MTMLPGSQASAAGPVLQRIASPTLKRGVGGAKVPRWLVIREVACSCCCCRSASDHSYLKYTEIGAATLTPTSDSHAKPTGDELRHDGAPVFRRQLRPLIRQRQWLL